MIENNYLDYATETRKARRKGAGGTQEFFTPSVLVKKMCDKIPETDWSDITKSVLEPCAGNGNFLVEILARKLSYCKSIEDIYTALSSIYAVELMQDNVDECKERLLMQCIKFSASKDWDLEDKKVIQILDKQIICSDFFKWDFENWKPLK